ncbi:DUF2079 domain-containing protein [Capilliphycus salinus ALCB114379]|uniref:DUF2079 domain-containing protein n=1 Tax=Capilliphycus salinus TaxID=2768948 RepID=UPI0039A732C5
MKKFPFPRIKRFQGRSFKLHPLAGMIVIASILLFFCSSLRHALFQSTAFELGIYDQVVYLMSQGKPPISSFLNIHHMGNHAAWVMYFIALFYRIYPSVHWLLFIQAISLALGAWPTWGLAREAGLNRSLSLTMAVVYLLYPVVFNINLFDFHPEVMALPVFLGAILAAKLNKIFWFCLAIIWILGCKDAMSLTVAAMGIWLFFCEKKRLCGIIALFAGVGWFIIVVQGIIPYFKAGLGPGGVGRYTYLGDSVVEIIVNLILKPRLVLERVFSWKTLEYVTLFLSPVFWWLSPRQLTPFMSALPALVKNILSEIDAQRDLIHQYSIPILPFLIVAMISSLAHSENYLGKWVVNVWQTRKGINLSCIQEKKIIRKLILIWSFISFLCLAKFGYFWSIYLREIDTWTANRLAVNLIQNTQGSVLTTANLAPHLTHRPVVEFTNVDAPPTDLTQFDYVLLNVRHPGWKSNRQFAQSLVNQLENLPQFQLKLYQDEVYVFQKINKLHPE